MGEDLSRVARQMIMVSLNAAIEAAHAGHIARGFVVVAAEVKNQAQHVQALSGDMCKTLNTGELTTTATFQDIQAGGKMMMAAISGLELMVNTAADGTWLGPLPVLNAHSMHNIEAAFHKAIRGALGARSRGHL